jgi:SAM-dependent methyltransferase
MTAVDQRFAPVASSRTFNRILDTLDLRTKKTLDIGCGYGEYLVKFGPGSIGITTTDAEVEYGKSNGIDIIKGNAERIDEFPLGGLKSGDSFEAVWANNLFEHLLSPHAFLVRLKKVAVSDGLLVLGVPVIPALRAMMKLKAFRGALAVAHVNFFTKASLKLTVLRAGWHVSEIRPFIFSNKALDYLASFFAPHLYVVARNRTDFKYDPKKLKEWKNDPHYQSILGITRQ